MCLNSNSNTWITPGSQYQHTSYGKEVVYEVSVRVKVCDPSVRIESNCRQYSQGWKPEGLLQEYSDKLTYSVFGYLNDSSEWRDGGVLRANQKFIGPYTHYPEVGEVANANKEWDPDTGELYSNPNPDDAKNTGYNVSNSGVINYLNKFGQMTSAKAKSLDPVSELYYAAIRYLKNLGNVSSYSDKLSDERADGFPVITNWNDPIRYSCQVNAILGIGDVYTHRDKNLPGSKYTDGEPSRPQAVGDDDSVNVMTATQKVFDLEGLGTLSNPFSGRYNSAFIAGLAYDSHTVDMRPDDAAKPQTSGMQTVSTYWVDVRENQYLEPSSKNQYWLAAKYGGFRVPTGYDPYARTEPLPESWWHTTSDYLDSGTGGGITQTVTTYPRADNFYVASEADKMVESLRQAFENIVAALKGSGTAMAANTTKLESGAMTFQAQFITGDDNEWGGELLGYEVDTETGALEQAWAATEKFPLWGPTNESKDSAGKARQIFYNGGAGKLKAFEGDAIPGLDLDQVNYVRGDRSQEESNGGSFRNRESMLGDIVNSQPVYVGAPSSSLYANQSFTGASDYAAFANDHSGRTKVVYVGANDGMLHAFNADTGREIFAFIPSAALAGLANYTDPDYEHAYSVDGELTVADAYVGGSWKTILVGTMGRGGKAVFALDVTKPEAPELLWEKTYDVLGNNLGQPIIAQVADGEWRVLMGNGPNSTSGHAQLVMITLADGSISSIDTGVGDDNGLSGINAWSSAGNGIVDTVYAGDLKGNLWKFTNLNSTGTTLKLFAAGSTKPITSTPLVAIDPDTTKTWVWFGTGKYLSTADIVDTATQTWYGLIDGNATITDGLNEVEMIDEGVVSGTLARTLESYDAAGTNGWYFDLPDKGERMVVANEFLGEMLVGVTRIPNSSDVCSSGGTGYTMAIDPFTGGRISKTIFDVNGDGVFDDKDLLNGNPVSGIGHSSAPAGSTALGDYLYTTLDNGTTEITKINSASNDITRVSWRELIRD